MKEVLIMMNAVELVKKIEAIKELEAFVKELDGEIRSYEAEIKAFMNEEGLETINAGKYVVRNIPVMSLRFDTKRFKNDFGSDVYAEYCKEVESVRFSIN